MTQAVVDSSSASDSLVIPFVTIVVHSFIHGAFVVYDRSWCYSYTMFVFIESMIVKWNVSFLLLVAFVNSRGHDISESVNE